MTRLLYKVPGIGKIIASVIAASVPDAERVQVGTRFHRLARPHAEAKLKAVASRQLGELSPSPSRGTDTSGNCSCWGDLAAKRSGQAQRRLAPTGLLACWRRNRRGWLRWRYGQQARPNLWAMMKTGESVPHRDVREGVRKPLLAARSVHKGDLQVRVWQAQRDVMNDTVATEDQEQPAGCHQRKARVADRDPGRRITSGQRT